MSYLSQLISFFFLPVFTHHFSPEDFGYYATFNASVSVISVFSTWRYYLAIALPNSQDDARDLFWGVFSILALMTTAISLLSLSIPKQLPITGINNKEINAILLLIAYYAPASFFLIGTQTLLNSWVLRNDGAHLIGIATLIQTCVTLSCQLLLRQILEDGPSALITGVIIGQTISLFFLSFTICFRASTVLPHPKNCFKQLRRYKQLPLSVFQTEFLNSISKRTVPILLTSYYGAHIAGLWSMCNSLIGNPFGVITSSLWQVSHNKLAKIKKEEKNIHILKTHNLVCYLLALPVFLIIGLADLIPEFLGEKWGSIVSIVPVFLLMVFLNAISNTTSYFVIFVKYRQETLYNILLVILPLSLFFSGEYFIDGITAIYIFCISSMLLYLSLNLYWGRTTGNLKSFIVNLFTCILLNVFFSIYINYMLKESIIITFSSVAAYIIVYFKFLLRRKFIDLQQM